MAYSIFTRKQCTSVPAYPERQVIKFYQKSESLMHPDLDPYVVDRLCLIYTAF